MADPFIGAASLPDDGIEQDTKDYTDEQALKDSRDAKPFLLQMKLGTFAKFVIKRWKRMDKQALKIQNELRVNYLRFKGNAFAQVHPTNSNQLYVGRANRGRTPPTINKIRRTVHRYVAQVTADEPIMEGVPATHDDDARDAAEAGTASLRGEWHRMSLQKSLQRVTEIAAIMRSGFWDFEFDKYDGNKVPAQKYFDDELGNPELKFVGADGNVVDDAKQAKMIWEGNTVVQELSPMNVRWAGGRTLKKASEVFVAKIVTLGDLYEMEDSLREVKLNRLLGHVSKEQREWLEELLGANGIVGRNTEFSDDELELTGRQITDDSSILDQPVMLLRYYRKPSKQYPDGLQAMIAGEHTVYRKKLRYGLIPLAQLRLLDDVSDPLGLGLVDLLKDPQELLDFVNTQILRFLQTMRRRWFVGHTSNVNARDLLNPTRSIIKYNANAEPPVPEEVQNIPESMTKLVDRFDQGYNDESGIHDTMQGKHVPGVSSGRHAEALRSGDETILGMSRLQIQEFLEDAGQIMLAINKKEWSRERRVRYWEDRQYIEEALSSNDFGDTMKVRLKRGTLLMLTQAQKLETMFGYAEMGVLTPSELRKLAPVSDTAGISITEDPHYQKARRENKLFLKGPNDTLMKARKTYEKKMLSLESDLQYLTEVSSVGADDELNTQAAQIAAMRVEAVAKAAEQSWLEVFSRYSPTLEEFERNPSISAVHAAEHAGVLAGTKAKRLPIWWTKAFEVHTLEHMQAAQPPMPEEEGELPPQEAGGVVA